MHMELRDQCHVFFPNHPLLYLWRQGPLLNLYFTSTTRLAGWWPLGKESACLYLSNSGIRGTYCRGRLFKMKVLRIELWSSCTLLKNYLTSPTFFSLTHLSDAEGLSFHRCTMLQMLCILHLICLLFQLYEIILSHLLVVGMISFWFIFISWPIGSGWLDTLPNTLFNSIPSSFKFHSTLGIEL